MLKKVALTSLFTILSISILFIIYLTVEKVLEKKDVSKRISELPNLNLVNLDGSDFDIPATGAVALILFESECDHCQYEVKNISENLKELKNGILVFISSESPDIIRAFSNQHNLGNIPFVHFVRIKNELIFETFGTIAVPHTLIYDKDHRLVKEFTGETKAEAILRYLK